MVKASKVEMYTALQVQAGNSLQYLPESGVSLDKIGLPSIHYKAHGHTIGNKCVCVACFMIKEGTDPKDNIMTDKVVGMVKDRQDFGEIVFKDFFLEKYPVLKNYIVIRECPRVFVAYPKKENAAQIQYNDAIDKRGRPRNTIPCASPKSFGATFICSSIANSIKLKESLSLSGLSKSNIKNLLSYTYYSVIEGADFNSLSEKAKDNYYTSSTAVSKGRMNKIINSITFENIDNFCNSRVKLAIEDNKSVDDKFLVFGTIGALPVTHRANKASDNVKQINGIYVCLGNTILPIFYKILQENALLVKDCEQYLDHIISTAIEFKKENNISDWNILLALEQEFLIQQNIEHIFEEENIQALINVPRQHPYFDQAISLLENNNVYEFNQKLSNLDNYLQGLSTTIDVSINKQKHKLYLYAYFNYAQSVLDKVQTFTQAMTLISNFEKGLDLSQDEMKLIDKGIVELEYKDDCKDSVKNTNKSKSFNMLMVKKCHINMEKLTQVTRENNIFVFVSTVELGIWEAYKYYSLRNENELSLGIFEGLLQFNCSKKEKDKALIRREFMAFNANLIYQELANRMHKAKNLIKMSKDVRDELGSKGAIACQELLQSVPQLLSSFKEWKITPLTSGSQLSKLEEWKRILLKLLGIEVQLPSNETIASENYEQYIIEQLTDEYL